MKLNLDSFVSKDVLINNFSEVERKIKRYGQVVILDDNKPMYKLSLLDMNEVIKTEKPKRSRVTLVEAMICVLTYASDTTMHAKDLAEEITDKELYFMKDGSSVTAVQIRARANNNLDKFECMAGNYIKLRAHILTSK